MGLRDLLRGRRGQRAWAWDDDDPLAAEHELVARYLDELPASPPHAVDVRELPAGREILEAERPAQARAAAAALQRLVAARGGLHGAAQSLSYLPNGTVSYPGPEGPLLREAALLDDLAGALLRRTLYLVVEGGLNTYWIHLGSGTVMMEPGSRYLCIVRDGSAGASRSVRFLPFEDTMLSMILSKAFLLADDRRIEDPAIVSQLRR